ncbi:MAG: hypothetical protein AAGA77_00905 [Bacteroidota bacterium]
MERYKVLGIVLLGILISYSSFGQEKVGINTTPSTELDVRTTANEDGADINVGNADNSHFLRLFSGKSATSFPNPAIYWKDPDSLMFGRLGDQFLELLRLNPDGDILMKEGGIAFGTDSTDGFFEIYVDSTYSEAVIDQMSVGLPGDDSEIVLNNSNAFGQSFTVGISGSALNITVNEVFKNGNTSTFLRLNIYEGNSPGGVPIKSLTGEVLCSDPISCQSAPNVMFNVSSNVEEGDEFFIELLKDSGEDITMSVSNPGQYNGGQAWFYSADNWNSASDYDGEFYTSVAIPQTVKIPFMKIYPNGNGGRVQINDYYLPNDKGEPLQVMTTTASGQLIFTNKDDEDWEVTTTELYTPNRNVGIGLDQPEVDLHIRTENDNNGVLAGIKIENPGVGSLPDEMMLIDGNEIDAYGAENEVSNEALHLQNNSPGDIYMVNGGGNVGIGYPNDGTSKLLVSGQNGMKVAFWLNGPSLNIKHNSIQTIGDSTSHPLYLQSDGNLYQSLNSGGVGIGTTNIPTDYKLAVEGKVIAEEIRVELQANWPDYVFEDSYPLIPLEQLDEVIKDQQHLPGIPSASEIGDNGQHLGEIQIKLLEKIEELTLYIIELNKRIKELESLQK